MSVARKGLSRIGAVLLCGLICSGPAAGQTVDRAVEEAFWDSVKGCSSAAQVEAYLEAYPKGRYVDAARACLARLRWSSLSPGTVNRDCPACPEMVVVAAGSFTMGSPPNEKGRLDREGPQRTVTIATPFAVGKHEVTNGEWEACVAAGECEEPLFRRDRDRRRPVVGVRWRDAKAYVSWLSRRTGKDHRLLSEAEWEYAARGGTPTRYHWGDDIGDDRANCTGCGSRWDGKRTAPVGSFAANRFGLHDMHGNVWEWVEDCWHESYAGAPSDGRARTTGGDCFWSMLRGGSWQNHPLHARAANRIREWAGAGDRSIGFRVARTLEP